MSSRKPFARAKPRLGPRLCCLLVGAACGLLVSAAGWAAPHIGADVELIGRSPEAQAAELSRLTQAGVQSVRWRLDWNRVEPAPGAFGWETDDAIVDAALAQGLEVVLVLGPCAEWAVDPARDVPADQRQFSVPKEIGAWEHYVREAASHFRGRVRHWQVRSQPNVRNFRGTRGEFLRLLTAAGTETTDIDPEALIIMPESGSLGLAAIARLAQSDAWRSFDALGVYLDQRPGDLSSLALPWAVLSSEVLPRGEQSNPRPVWVLGADGPLSADAWVQRYLLSWAFGAERCYLPAAAISSEWTTAMRGAELTGYLRLGPEVWMLTFTGEQGPFVMAWSAEEVTLPAPGLAPIGDLEAALTAAPLGGAPGSAAVAQGESAAFVLGPRPVLIPGLCPD